MTTYTHTDLIAAIDRARPTHYTPLIALERNAHLDLCVDILDLHQEGNGLCTGCYGLVDVAGNFIGGCVRWPCPTVWIVINDLKKMGLLP